MTPTVGYLRVSTEEQARGDRTSLAQQRDGCTAIAGSLGRSIDQWFTDPGASGGSAKRPGFQALIAFCRAHPCSSKAPGLVVALNASRWGRFPNRNEAHWWMFELERIGWNLRYAEGDDATNPTAQHIIRAVGSGISADYREAIRQNAIRGWQATAKAGYWQNEAPFGFRRQTVSAIGKSRILEPGQRKAQDERVTLTPGPHEEVALIRWLFRRYATGERSLANLAEEAIERFPARRWSKQVIRATLQNPAYQGDVVWGRRPQLPEGGKQAALTDPETWVVHRNAHPALVSRALFAQVQARFTANRGQTRLSAGGYPLSGLLTCAHCPDHFIGGGGPRGPAGEPNRYRFYRHAVSGSPQQQRDPAINDCPAIGAILPKRIIEPAVIAAVSEIVASPHYQRILATVIDRRLAQLQDYPEREAAQLLKRKAQLLQERERLVKLAGLGTFDDTELAPRVSAIRAELAQLEAAAQRTRFTARRVTTLEGERGRLLERAANFAQAIVNATGPRLKTLLRPWLHAIVADRLRNTLTVTLNPLPAGAGLFDSSHWPGRG